MVMSGIFNSPQGIVLVLTGLAAFIFRSVSMFIVYGISLAWAVIWTFVDALYVKQAYWFIVAGFQLFLSIMVFTDYRRFRKMELEPLDLHSNCRSVQQLHLGHPIGLLGFSQGSAHAWVVHPLLD